jgi:hypothetical protein
MEKIVLGLFLIINIAFADNQTADLTPILVDEPLPFDISIELAGFTLPQGIQSAAAAQHKGKYLFIAGRINGLHGFDPGDNNFPPDEQNTTVFVIDPYAQTVATRSLYDPSSGLTQAQIDSLSVTACQFYQKGNTLYITGGYGVDTATGNFSTKDILSAINVSGLMHWATHPECACTASEYIRQISNPVFQVTGGHMSQFGKNPTLLMFGQNFDGFYTPSSTGDYTYQVRRFYILDNGTSLGVEVLNPAEADSSYRRRDLNVAPIVKIKNKEKLAAFVALSGVFTPSNGVWTVPVDIAANGYTHIADPSLATTFKQGMNNYICPHVELLSKSGNNYIILFGGITYEFFQNGEFLSDPELPFTNQVTIVKRNKRGAFTQYLSPNQYPIIASTGSHPGNTLLFGGQFMPFPGFPTYTNGVINLAQIACPTIIGYIIGGIQSTLPNTFSPSDSAASPYVFKVILTPRRT